MASTSMAVACTICSARRDPYVNRMLTGEDFHHHCHSNLTRAVLPHGLTEFDVHDVLNIFQCTGLNHDDMYFMKACPAKKGDYLEFFAEIDLLCALSTCPGGDLSLADVGAGCAGPADGLSAAGRGDLSVGGIVAWNGWSQLRNVTYCQLVGAARVADAAQGATLGASKQSVSHSVVQRSCASLASACALRLGYVALFVGQFHLVGGVTQHHQTTDDRADATTRINQAYQGIRLSLKADCRGEVFPRCIPLL
jgi:hypothetical protein